jgi:PERQ amino acid-rich with GYF domain-containing protein
MRQWLEAGYFKGDLPISQASSGPFHPLSIWFPDLNYAFRPQPINGKDTRQALVEEKVKAEAAEKERLRQEAEAAAERQRSAVEESRRVEQEAATAVADNEQREASVRGFERPQQLQSRQAQGVETHNTTSGNESSAQLKMMLGLSAGAQSTGADDSEALEPAVSAKNSRNVEKKSSKATNKKNSQKSVDDNPATSSGDNNTQSVAPAPVAPSAPAWGGVANTKPKKSMSEIQQEEARAAATLAAKRGNLPQPNSSGWANVAAGTSGWSSGTLRSSAAGQNPSGTPVPNQSPSQMRPKAQAALAQGGTNRKVAPITQQQRSSSTASSTPAEEFGTSMSPSLEKWCKEKMQQINGSDDLTLIAFCMTLNDANEIRQYLITYLGNTAQVNSFATEFINKRGLGSKQEEWETPGSAKKGRKKKAGR